MSDMTIEKAVENYMGGIDCSQAKDADALREVLWLSV